MPKGETASQLLGSVLARTFRLERVIGEGGWGAVFEASHVRLRRRFAIKLLYPEVAAEEESQRRFRREALVTSELGHPNIVEVVDFNHTPQGSPYLVMELLEGEDLHDRLARVKRLPLRQTNRLLGQIASALHAAHERRIVHRDLKPRNIFLARVGHRVDVVKVLDFGISKVLDSASRLTGASSLMGTPAYMAPEQAEGRVDEVSAATDVFALGALVFKMLAGRPPFVGSSIPDLLRRIVHEAPPKLHDLAPDVPPAVSEVVDVALRKRPEQRHPSVTVFQRAFRRAAGAAGEPDVEMTEPPATADSVAAGAAAEAPHGAQVHAAVARPSVAATPALATSISDAVTIQQRGADVPSEIPQTLRQSELEAASEPAAAAAATGSATQDEITEDVHGRPSRRTMAEYGQYVKPRLRSRLLLVLLLLLLAGAGAVVAFLLVRRGSDSDATRPPVGASVDKQTHIA